LLLLRSFAVVSNLIRSLRKLVL